MAAGNSLTTKLQKIQLEMKAPKSLTNKFGGYNYRNAELICEAFKPYGDKYKCTLYIYDTIEVIGDRFYVKATATLRDCETPEEISVSAFAREPEVKKGMDDAQVTGATSSYARKYALNGLFLLDDTKDPDTDEYRQENEERAKAQPKFATPKQIESLKAIYVGENEQKLFEAQKIKSWEELPMEVASTLIRKLKEKKNG